MSASTLAKVVHSIQRLPAGKRTQMATRLVRSLTPDTVESKMETALAQGRFNSIYAKALQDYTEGRALERIY